MLLFAYYLLKVSTVSALLYGYYLIALRNKKFHQYNRFYLLFTVLLSLIIPLAKIKFWNETVQHEMPAIRLLKVVATRDTIAEESLKSWFGALDFTTAAFVIFSIISTALSVWLVSSIVRIIILIRSNPSKSWNNISFIFTEAKGTPFSFFKYIFWNNEIDLETEEGKLILQHELTHVQEKHSVDKLFINAALVIGWPNPFFWIIRKELNMIHEFIADEKAISDGDTASFSAMLLKAAYPQHSFAFANSFFHSPIKRRLVMFTTSKKPSYSYLRRLLILPLLSFLIVFFSFKIKGKNTIKSSDNTAKAPFQISLNKDLQEKIYRVIERFAVNKTCDTCLNTGVGVLELSNLDNTTKVKTVYASDNQFDFDDDKVLITKLDEISEQLKVPFDVVVPIHFWSYEDQQSFNPNITQPSPELMKEAQEKIDDLSKQKTVFGPVVITAWSKNVKNKAETKPGISAINNSDTTEAKFPGGNQEWKKYLETNLNANVAAYDKAPAGTYTVKVEFAVTETGDVKDVAAIQIPAGCPSCATEAVRIIRLGPKWEPMTIGGKNAATRSVQFVSFQVAE